MITKMVQPIIRSGFAIPLGILIAVCSAQAQSPETEFFEKEIRPVLVEKCYGCHSSKLKSPMGGLILDTKAGLKAGGNTGPIIVPGDPKSSRLIAALGYNLTDLRMPPTGKLPDAKIDAFRQMGR